MHGTDDCSPFPRAATQDAGEDGFKSGIQVGGRLIEKDDVRLLGQATSQPGSLPLAQTQRF